MRLWDGENRGSDSGPPGPGGEGYSSGPDPFFAFHRNEKLVNLCPLDRVVEWMDLKARKVR